MELENRRIAILAEDGYEDLELWYPLLRMREAGAEWEDQEEVVVDNHLISSRRPGDLPAFCRAIIEALS
jgi:putative intracellular protease/amidase